jgi:hypothetical protein
MNVVYMYVYIQKLGRRVNGRPPDIILRRTSTTGLAQENP